MPAPTLKQRKQEIIDFVLLSLRDKYDALKTTGERPHVTTAGHSIRVRFADFKDDVPIIVRVDVSVASARTLESDLLEDR